MNEREYDRSLRIKTVGTREWMNRSSHYNRYEATPYIALEELFRNYDVKRSDVFVDFGCGKGRLPFYVNHHFGVSATGIEMSGQLFQEALENQANYMMKAKSGGTVRFECGLAEAYKVESMDNRFYFFNPFSLEIFMKVIDSILQSVEKGKRSLDIILYYPTSEYVEFLDYASPFELVMEVQVPEMYDQNDNERFLIYRYDA